MVDENFKFKGIVLLWVKGCFRNKSISRGKKELILRLDTNYFQLEMELVWEKSVQKRRKYQEMKTRIKFDGPSNCIPSQRNSDQRKNLVLWLGQRACLSAMRLRRLADQFTHAGSAYIRVRCMHVWVRIIQCMQCCASWCGNNPGQ